MIDEEDYEFGDLAIVVGILADTEAANRELQAALAELKQVVSEMRLYFLQPPGDDLD